MTKQELLTRPTGEGSTAIRARVKRARQVQWERMKGEKGRFSNSQLDTKGIRKYCTLNEAAKELLEMAIDRFALSARAYTRVLKVARTIADLGGAEDIAPEHVAEALQYRAANEDFAL